MIGFFLVVYHFFGFNWTSFFSKGICVNLYKLTFSIPPFSTPNQTKMREIKIFSIISLFHPLTILYPPTFSLLQPNRPLWRLKEVMIDSLTSNLFSGLFSNSNLWSIAFCGRHLLSYQGSIFGYYSLMQRKILKANIFAKEKWKKKMKKKKKKTKHKTEKIENK